MRMYPRHDLFRQYKKRSFDATFSSQLQDETKRITLEHMNFAINFCDSWNSFLDIGGGSGHYSTALSAKFREGTVIDIGNYPEHPELVKKYPNLSVANVPVEKYKSENKADFILLADLFEHIQDIKTFVIQLSKLQTKGGVIYMMTPNPVFCGPATESALHFTRHPHGHVRHYPANEIISLMTCEGYDLCLHLFEEAPMRQKMKIWLKGISRRDKSLDKFIIYRTLRPFILLILKPLFLLAGYLTYHYEKKARHNELRTLTQDLVFKKTR